MQRYLTALRRVTRPRLRDLVVRAAASGRLGGPAASRSEVGALLSLEPEFDAEGFLSTVSYENERDRAVLLEALRSAGLA